MKKRIVVKCKLQLNKNYRGKKNRKNLHFAKGKKGCKKCICYNNPGKNKLICLHISAYSTSIQYKVIRGTAIICTKWLQMSETVSDQAFKIIS